jgi:hypothetical protein
LGLVFLIRFSSFQLAKLLVDRLNRSGEFFVFFFQSLNVQAQVVLNSLAVTAIVRFDRIDVLENTAR